MNYIGQIFGNRKVISNICVKEDWISLGFKVPTRPDKYVLTQCLNCGKVLPCDIRNLKTNPPKRCVFCSNIGNHSNIKTNTNSWTCYEDYAVCNIVYKSDIISAYIDIADYETISKYVWRVSKKRQKYYLVSGSSKKGTMVYMHTMVLGNPKDTFEIDHIDGNSLNNRRVNLRFVSRQENIDNQIATRIDNSIGIRGITYSKTKKTYSVDFHYHGKRYYTKDWNTLEEAVWCRTCFEDYFNINSIRNNPIAKEYYTLNDRTKENIKQYVTLKILGNER